MDTNDFGFGTFWILKANVRGKKQHICVSTLYCDCRQLKNYSKRQQNKSHVRVEFCTWDNMLVNVV